ncbi:MAG TPA: hypothetical protein VH518_06350 [Tepidisphaeraceae bacterium]|jgi:hypothetical protein
MRTAAILLVIGCITSNALAGGPTREEVAIQPSGPVTISPWRAAAEKRPDPNWDHYRFSVPPGYFYCGWGCHWGWGWSGCGWGFRGCWWGF